MSTIGKTPIEARGHAQPEVLVSTEWVAEHMDDPTVRIVEVDVDTAAYNQGHIPGAVGWNWQRELQDQLQRDIVGKADFERLMEASGIGNDTTVILYGDTHNWFATYAFWLLKYYGHEDARVMNGGRARWLAEGRPLTTKVPVIPRANYQARQPNLHMRVLRDPALGSLAHNHDVVLADGRPPAKCRCEQLAPAYLPEEGLQRGGHIRGARNIVWSNAVRENGIFTSPEERRALCEGEGVAPDREGIAYYRIGERSPHTWFALGQPLASPRRVQRRRLLDRKG
ncbi:MAG: sulfurtransferase [Ardenticatenaceae bacterium]|nr:sulfurtransferase [Ardenticatenaceae bacterium]